MTTELSPPDDLSTGRKAFFRNTGFSLLQQVVNVGLAIALVPYLLWQLGTETYGLWLILQLFNIFGLMALADLGLQGAIIRHLVKRRADGDAAGFRELLSTSLVCFGVIGAVTATLILWFAQTAFVTLFNIPAESHAIMRMALSIYALNLVLAFPFLVIKGFYSAMQDVATLKVWEMAERVLLTVLIVVVLFVRRDLLWLVLCELFAMALVSSIFVAMAVRRHRGWFVPGLKSVRPSGMRGVWGMSGLVFLFNIANQLFVKGPELLVGAILGPTSLAYFSIASRIPRLIKTLQSAANAAVLPYASLLASQANAEQARRRFALAGLRTSYLIIVPVSAFLLVFADDVLTLWVGQDYVWLANLMRLAVLWQLASIIGTFGGATFTSNAHLKSAVWPMLAFNGILLAALAPSLDAIGLTGLFVALFVGGLMGSAVMLRATARANAVTYGDFLRDVMAGPILLSGILGLGLFLAADRITLGFGLPVRLTAGTVAGFVLLAISHRLVLTSAERLALSRALARQRQEPQ